MTTRSKILVGATLSAAILLNVIVFNAGQFEKNASKQTPANGYLAYGSGSGSDSPSYSPSTSGSVSDSYSVSDSNSDNSSNSDSASVSDSQTASVSDSQTDTGSSQTPEGSTTENQPPANNQPTSPSDSESVTVTPTPATPKPPTTVAPKPKPISTPSPTPKSSQPVQTGSQPDEPQQSGSDYDSNPTWDSSSSSYSDSTSDSSSGSSSDYTKKCSDVFSPDYADADTPIYTYEPTTFLGFIIDKFEQFIAKVNGKIVELLTTFHIVGYEDDCYLTTTYETPEPEKVLVILVPGAGGNEGEFAFIKTKFENEKEKRDEIVYFNYSSKDDTDVSKEQLNSFVSNYKAEDYRKIAIIAHSNGNLVTREAVLTANGKAAEVYKKATLYSISPILGGSEIALQNAPAFAKVYQDPLGPQQAKLFSRDNIYSFNSKIGGYKSYIVSGNPYATSNKGDRGDYHLTGIWKFVANKWGVEKNGKCVLIRNTSVFRDRVANTWVDYYFAGASKEHVEYYANEKLCYHGFTMKKLTVSPQGGEWTHVMLLSYDPLITEIIEAILK